MERVLDAGAGLRPDTCELQMLGRCCMQSGACWAVQSASCCQCGQEPQGLCKLMLPHSTLGQTLSLVWLQEQLRLLVEQPTLC